MRYSVIIPVYNRPDEVDELLQSLTQQSFKDFEVIVVEDNCCKDVRELDLSVFVRLKELRVGDHCFRKVEIHPLQAGHREVSGTIGRTLL